MPRAYPIYDDRYRDAVARIRAWLPRNLAPAGRNGMHKYNNQDHAIMTAMLTVENIVAGEAVYDVWQVNQDAEYHEEGDAGSDLVLADAERLTPMRASST